MSFRDSWINVGPQRSRRFTTLEGWREIGAGVYVVGASRIQVPSIRHQFVADEYYNDRTSWTGLGKTDVISLQSWQDREVSVEAVKEDKNVSVASEQLYHVFSNKRKWAVVIMIGMAGLFSGLSSNIYFPALDAISKDLDVSLDAVSLTITSYLIIQGISPLFWGSLSDSLGRRPIYIYSFSTYIVANIGLSFSPNFMLLLVFRGLQAAGSASTVSIGNGVIQDITPPAERGGYISFYQAIRSFSIAVSPVIGGLLTNFLGFRSIFVFLLILSSLTIIAIIFFFPETLRGIAGNGTLRLTGIHRPLIDRFIKEPPYMQDRNDLYTPTKVNHRTFIEPLLLLKEKDILLSLIFGGIIYAIWSMVTASTIGLFKRIFHLNELQIGLVFLPNGLGTIFGSTIIGNLMNRDYCAAERAYKFRNGLQDSYNLPKTTLPAELPIEHARLKHTKWITALFIICTSVYGFSLSFPSLTSRPGWITVPLVLQFFIAATSNAVFAINQTMVSDLCPGKGASSTAINNLVRCSMGAVGVSIIERLITSVGAGGTFLCLGLVTVAFVPLLVVQWYWGPIWRRERIEKKTQGSSA